MSRAWLVLPVLGLTALWIDVKLVNHHPARATEMAHSAQPSAAAATDGGQTLDRTQVLSAGALCDLEQVSGRITVKPASGRTAHLHAALSARGTGEAARRALSRVHIEYSGDEHGLRARTVYERGGWSEPEVDVVYDLELPSGVALKLKTVSGDIDVSGADAGVQVHDVSGQVRLHRAASPQVEDVSGDIQLDEVSGHLQIKTVSGGVHGSLATSPALSGGEIHAVSGDIQISAPAGADLGVHATTLSGDIRNDFSQSGAIPLRIQTVSGDIHVSKR